MSTLYTARVGDALGTRLASFANFVEAGSSAALDYVLSVGKIGVLTMTLPATVDPALLPLDGRISVWRSINGAPPVMDGQAVYMIRKWDFGTDFTTVTALHVNELFARRIIAYTTDQTYAQVNGVAADNAIKAYLGLNLIGGITFGRTAPIIGGDIAPLGVSLQANLGLGAVTSKAASWRNLLDVIAELCEASTQNGTYLAAEMVAPTESTLEARTYAGQRGVDHRAGSASPVIFSEARGNLKHAVLQIDRTQEVTVAIAGGQGEGAARILASAADLPRLRASPFGWREAFVDATNATTTAQVQAAADAAVWAGRPIVTLTADLVETPGCTRGIHFDLGDMVTIEHRGTTIDVRLDLIHETLTSSERRSEIRVQAVLPT